MMLIVIAIQSIGFQILVPNLPVYALRFTSSETLIGILAASISLSALVARPFTSVLADRGNVKRIIIVAQIAMAAGSVWLIFAPGIATLIIIRLLQGIFFSVITTTTMTTGIRAVPLERMGYGVSLLTIVGIGSQAIAPALGVYIADRMGYEVLFLFVGLLSAISGLVAIALDPTPVAAPKDSAKKKIVLRDLFATEVIDLAVITLIFTSSTSIITNFVLLYGSEKGITGIGFYFTLYAAVLILLRIAGGSLIDRFPYQHILAFCAVLSITGLVFISQAQTFTHFAIAAIFMGIGYGYANPAAQTAMIKRVDPSRIGATTAMMYIGMDVAHTLGPMGMGMLAENVGYEKGFLTYCIPVALSVILAYYGSRKKNQEGKLQ